MLNILYIEDDLNAITLITDFLKKKYGCCIETASTNSEIKKRMEKKYDIIITDTCLIENDNITLVRDRKSIVDINLHNANTILIVTDCETTHNDETTYYCMRSKYHNSALANIEQKKYTPSQLNVSVDNEKKLLLVTEYMKIILDK